MQSLTLYQIESELAQLLDLREAASQEEIATVDAEIQGYVAREVRKVDGICHAIHAYEAAAAEAKAEAKRISDRAAALDSRAKQIKESTLYAMQVFEVKSLETPTNRIRRQSNGGSIPLEIDEEVLPESFKRTILVKDVDAIRAALKRGETIPGVKGLERGEHIRIE